MGRPPFGFEPVDHTADAAIRGWGRDLSELFTAMARGLFDVIARTDSVHAVRSRAIALRADTVDELLHDWLETLNTLHQVHGELYRDFTVRVEDADGLRLQARVHGETIDPARHELRMEVKAVTWHGLSLRRTDAGYEAYVLFDI
jgi:SHS2 domain-containing protein